AFDVLDHFSSGCCCRPFCAHSSWQCFSLSRYFLWQFTSGGTTRGSNSTEEDASVGWSSSRFVLVDFTLITFRCRYLSSSSLWLFHLFQTFNHHGWLCDSFSRPHLHRDTFDRK